MIKKYQSQKRSKKLKEGKVIKHPTKKTEVNEGDTCILKADLYYIEEGAKEKLGSLITKAELDDVVMLYDKKGTVFTALESGYFDDVQWSSKNNETFLDFKWVE